EVSSDPWRYRDYIRDSRGEFTVAKELNVRLRSGWVADPTCCYLPARAARVAGAPPMIGHCVRYAPSAARFVAISSALSVSVTHGVPAYSSPGTGSTGPVFGGGGQTVSATRYVRSVGPASTAAIVNRPAAAWSAWWSRGSGPTTSVGRTAAMLDRRASSSAAFVKGPRPVCGDVYGVSLAQ